MHSSDHITSTRKDLQLARRMFHFLNGFALASAYFLFLSHNFIIHFLGTIACLVYILEQIRVKYPELHEKFVWITKYIIRAEEELKESAMVPYAIGILLTIITFPKIAAIIGIYTLAIADPLSAIVGIRFGKRHIVKHKTLEGSLAFFIATLMIHLLVFEIAYGIHTKSFLASIIASVLITFFEMIPLRIDDNLTIPIFLSGILWILAAALGLPLS